MGYLKSICIRVVMLQTGFALRLVVGSGIEQ
jgi:hypothetical protein